MHCILSCVMDLQLIFTESILYQALVASIQSLSFSHLCFANKAVTTYSSKSPKCGGLRSFAKYTEYHQETPFAMPCSPSIRHLHLAFINKDHINLPCSLGLICQASHQASTSRLTRPTTFTLIPILQILAGPIKYSIIRVHQIARLSRPITIF